MSDPEAHLMPNKEGGFAPNYTPVAAVEPVSGMIVAGEVAEGHNEASTVCGLVEAVAEVYGRKPQRVLFDGNFATGETLQVLEKHGVEVYAACRGADPHNPAYREDGRAPVDPAKVEGLPMRLGKFERAAFLWDEREHCFYCPAGRRLEYAQTLRRKEADGAVTESRVYRCLDCGGCPHASRCLGGKATTRSVSRDQYQPLRDKLAQRMRTEEGRSIYARRAPVAEGPIGTIKAAMGIRRFRRRGLAKVRADWQLICAAFNLKKLMRAFANAPTGSGSGPSAPPTPLGGALWLRIRRWWHQRRPPRRPALNFLRVPAPVAAGA